MWQIHSGVRNCLVRHYEPIFLAADLAMGPIKIFYIMSVNMTSRRGLTLTKSAIMFSGVRLSGKSCLDLRLFVIGSPSVVASMRFNSLLLNFGIDCSTDIKGSSDPKQVEDINFGWLWGTQLLICKKCLRQGQFPLRVMISFPPVSHILLWSNKGLDPWRGFYRHGDSIWF